MRKNKKLLLASVAAMGALALGVGATSTFAWYQTTNTAVGVAGSAQDIEDGTVTVNGPAAAGTSINYTITVTLTDDNSGKVLILSEWVSGTPGSYKSYTLDAVLAKVEHTPTSGQELVKSYTVTATGDWGSYAGSAADKAAILAANSETYTVTFSGGTGNDSRAEFGTAVGTGNNAGKIDSTSTTLSESVKNISTSGTVLGKLYIRVDGENKDGDDNVADNGSSFKVIIDATGSVA